MFSFKAEPHVTALEDGYIDIVAFSEAYEQLLQNNISGGFLHFRDQDGKEYALLPKFAVDKQSFSTGDVQHFQREGVDLYDRSTKGLACHVVNDAFPLSKGRFRVIFFQDLPGGTVKVLPLEREGFEFLNASTAA